MQKRASLPSAAEWLPILLWCGSSADPYLWPPVPEQPLSSASGSPNGPFHGPLRPVCCFPSWETGPAALNAGIPIWKRKKIINSILLLWGAFSTASAAPMIGWSTEDGRMKFISAANTQIIIKFQTLRASHLDAIIPHPKHSLTSSAPTSLIFRSRMVDSFLYFFSVSSLHEASNSVSRLLSWWLLFLWAVSSSWRSCSVCCWNLLCNWKTDKQSPTISAGQSLALLLIPIVSKVPNKWLLPRDWAKNKATRG